MQCISQLFSSDVWWSLAASISQSVESGPFEALIVCAWPMCDQAPWIYLHIFYRHCFKLPIEMCNTLMTPPSSPRSSVQIHWREHGGMLRVRHLPSIQLLRPCPSLRQKERDRERWRGRKREEHLSCSSSKSGRKSRGTLKWRIFWGKSACFAEDPLCWNHNQMEYELPNRNECMSAIFSNLSDFRAHPLIPPDRQIKSSLHPGRNLNHAGTLMYKNSSEAQPQRQIRPMVKINQQEKARFTEVL